MAIYLGDQQVAVNNYTNNSSITLSTLNATQNTTYNASNGQAYSSVVVNVDPLKKSIIRPDAELIKTYADENSSTKKTNYYAVTDYNMTITKPYDTTNRVPLAAGATLDATEVAVDLDNYDYLVLIRLLTIPIYNIDTVGKGRQEYQIQSSIYQISSLPTIGLQALANNTTYNSLSNIIPVSTCSRILYWSSATALALYTDTVYGALQVVTAPLLSSNKIRIRSPAIRVRGNSSYFTSTYYEALTDIHAQFVVNIYRAPKNHLATDGWGALDEMTKIINCVKNNNFVLT